MTLIEKVASELQRGVCKESPGFNDCDCPGAAWDNPTPAEQARAAIAAMREPTQAMLVCGHDAGWNGVIEGDNPCEEDAAGDLWERMIDEALK